MSLLLAFASMYIAGKVVAEAGREVTKIPARSKIQEDSKSGQFDVVRNFEEILQVCDVKRKKHNSSVPVLPYTPSDRCLKYIREHHLTCQADEIRFVHHYRKVLSEELCKRQKEWDQNYRKYESIIKDKIMTENVEIVRFTHFNPFVDHIDVETKVNEIYDNTFLGNLAVGDVKIKKETSKSYTEIWALKVPVSMKSELKELYDSAAQKCGYVY